MEALYKCTRTGCYHPRCDKMMHIMDREECDSNGNPLYTAYCDFHGYVVGGVREAELIYPKDVKNDTSALTAAEEIANKVIEKMPKAFKAISERMKKQARAINNQTKAFDLLRQEFRGENDSPHEMSKSNKFVVNEAIDVRRRLIMEGVSERNATTDACREVEAKYGIGKYASFEAFRDAVNTKVKNQAYSHGVVECLV